MEIDTSQVFTDEHHDAIKRLAASNLTRKEFEEILHQLPDRVIDLSNEQVNRIEQLESDGRIDEAIAEGLGMVFALKVTEGGVSARIKVRLDGLDNLPDKMAELERIGLNEMASEVAYIEDSLADSFPLPTGEIVRVYERVLTDNYDRLKREFNLRRTTKERKEALGISDVVERSIAIQNGEDDARADLDDAANAEYELTDQGKLLAKICPLFQDATPDTKLKVWSELVGLTLKQWALFIIETSPKRKDYDSTAERIKAIIKPMAKTIEQISGKKQIRSVTITEGSDRYAKDSKRVKEITQLLFADAVIRKSA